MANKKTIQFPRDLPSVDELLRSQVIQNNFKSVPHSAQAQAARDAIANARVQLKKKSAPKITMDDIFNMAINSLRAHTASNPTRVINCTGALAHTNLGRAPFSQTMIKKVSELLTGYSALEFDISTGERGKRGESTESLVMSLTGAEAALIVNNCAAALLLTLNTLANRKEVIVSRGELVQIGGGFRVPDIMRRSNAKLYEVGSTNITTLEDYEQALTDKTALILKVSQSNFSQKGFVESVPLKKLTALGRQNKVPVCYDQGSGLMVDPQTVGLKGSESVQSALKNGADLVCCSGDKLFGGPQAGIIVGKSEFISSLRKNPMYRALRPDKVTLYLLHSVFTEYLNGAWQESIPLWKMASYSESDLYRLGRGIIDEVKGNDLMTLEAVTARFGGGAAPDAEIPSCAIGFNCSTGADKIAEMFRKQSPPVIGRIESDRFILDIRTLQPDDVFPFKSSLKSVTAALRKAEPTAKTKAKSQK